jgi:uncharacterized protein involved in response to NO
MLTTRTRSVIGRYPLKWLDVLPPTGSAHRLFFPAAILWGLLAVPAWLLLYRERGDLLFRHGHAMLLGYGLAVAAGFLLARVTRHQLLALLVAWLVARLAPLSGATLVGAVGGLSFVALLAATGAARFLHGAKKGRNRVFALVLLGFALAEALYQAGALGFLADGEARGDALALDLLTLLMLQMGGRLIPAATAGALHRRGKRLEIENRVQPAVETGLTLLMVLVMLGDQVAALSIAAGGAAVLAAALTALRLARWRTLEIRRIPDLLGLHLGYGWLALGLALKGAAFITMSVPAAAGDHALGVGAMGTLTLVVMARTAATRRIPNAAMPPIIGLVAGLLGLAALLRVLGTFTPAPLPIWSAGTAWSAAFLVYAYLYARIAIGDLPPAQPAVRNASR